MDLILLQLLLLSSLFEAKQPNIEVEYKPLPEISVARVNQTESRKIGLWFNKERETPRPLAKKKPAALRSPSYTNYEVANSASIALPAVQAEKLSIEDDGLELVDYSHLVNKVRFAGGNNLTQELSKFSQSYNENNKEIVAENTVPIGSSDNDEMTFISFNDNAPVETETEQISKMVLSSIKREIGSSGRSNIAQQTPVANKEKPIPAPANALDSSSERNTLMNVILLDLENQRKESAQNPNYYLTSNKNNFFELEKEKGIFDHNCLSNCGVARVEMSGDNFIITYTDLQVDENLSKDYNVVSITQNSIDWLAARFNTTEEYGILLFERKNNEVDIDIDRSHAKKIFIDQNLKEVTYSSEWKYLLFVGVDPGNATLTYLHKNGSNIRVVSIEEGKLFYETSIPVIDQKQILQFYKDDSLATAEYPYTLSTFEIKPFDKGEHLSQQSSFEIEVSTLVRDSRFQNYKQLNTGNQAIYFGHRDQKVYMPTDNFIQNVVRDLNVNTGYESCITQINFEDSPINLEIEVLSVNDSMSSSVYFLDKDGSFSELPSPITTKMFLFGLGSGFISLNYEDELGRNRYAQTFCTPDIYLVEQL